MSTIDAITAPPSRRGRGSDYADLLAEVRRAGLLGRRPVAYAVRLTVNAVVFTGGQAGARRGAGRLLARHQGLLFLPMLLLEAVSLQVDSVRALARPSYRARGREAVLLRLHAAAYLTAVALVLSPWKALAFVAVHQDCSGCTWASRSRPTTRACRSSPPTTTPTSSAARC